MGARAAVGVFSPGLWRLEGLRELLQAERLVFRPGARRARKLDAVAGWGHKPTADQARRYAKQHGVPYLALEDGFLRSVGLGGGSEPPLSLIVDERGIYYDARGPSDLEHLLEHDPERRLDDAALLARAAQLRARIVATGVSKYNHAPDALPPELAGDDELVIVADQTYDDASVSGALADASTFQRALECALDEHPHARIVVKVHPATVAGKKRGYLAGIPYRSRVTIVSADLNPRALLRRAKRLYVCSSQLGFEGLLARVPVTCFGQAFYAGWGLTDDRQRCERRSRRVTLDQLVAAALLLYPRYRHPVTRAHCEAEEVVEHLALQRRIFAENCRDFVCFDMSYWKRPFVRRYLSAPGHPVRFARSIAELQSEPNVSRLTAVVWASRKTPALERWTTAHGIPLWHMEDGFLRSAGLGSDLTAPGSLVLDPEGIYYDPSRPSQLERILSEAELTDEELERAARLRQRIVSSRISKYNLPATGALPIRARPGQRVLFVPGQVANDASIRLGTPGISDNLGLLKEVRRRHPDAYIVYKPHPDVQVGNRQGALAQSETPPWDLALGQVPIAACLDACDEVHTMTSLVGFEALLRGLPVVTYGQPFYAGWGLTQDHAPLPRRTRRLSLDELVAGALLRYPRYVSWSARCFVSAEDKVGELERAALARQGSLRLPRQLIKLTSLWRSGVEWWHGRGLGRG
jgi:capsular polysaccharide export protein